jgi:uncharacterized protein YceH (UPF0502 family)
VLHRLAERELAKRLGRRPGQKEDRWEQLLGAESEGESAPEPAQPQRTPLEDRVAALERAVAELKQRLDRVADDGRSDGP